MNISLCYSQLYVTILQKITKLVKLGIIIVEVHVLLQYGAGYK